MKFKTDDYAKLAKGAKDGSPVPGWEIDKDLSTENYTVYRRHGHVVVAFSGTRLNHLEDLKADMHIATGHHDRSPRFHEGLVAVNNARHKYGHDKVEIAGHSLGGTIGMYTSDKLGVPAVVFQPGLSPIVDYNHMDLSNVHAIYDPKDPFGKGIDNIDKAKTGLTTQLNVPPPKEHKGFWGYAGSALKDFGKKVGSEVLNHPGEVAKTAFDVGAAVGLATVTDGAAIPAEEAAFAAEASTAGSQAEALAADGRGAYSLLPQDEFAADAADLRRDLARSQAERASKIDQIVSNSQRVRDYIAKGSVAANLYNDMVKAGENHKLITDGHANTPYTGPTGPTGTGSGSGAPSTLSMGPDGSGSTHYTYMSQLNNADTSVGPRQSSAYYKKKHARKAKSRSSSGRPRRQATGPRRSVTVFA